MSLKTQRYKVSGMTCSGCANAVERAASKVQGVQNAKVNLMENVLTLETEVAFEEIKAAVEDAGFGLEAEVEDEVEEERSYFSKYQLIITFLLSTPVFIIGMFYHHWKFGAYISFALTIPVMFWLGAHFYTKAFKLLKVGTANMDTLVALSTGVAFIYSTFNLFFPHFLLQYEIEPHLYFETIVVIIAFIKLGKWLEENAKKGSNSALKALSALIPNKVLRIENGTEKFIDTQFLRINDLVRVKPGDIIPVDGKVLKGRSQVNESAITGESMSDEKVENSQVFAGSINNTGVLDIQVMAISSDTLVGKVVENVKKSLQEKAPAQQFADKIAAIFVPIVLVIALLTFVGWLVIGGPENFAKAITAMIAVLVIACPCALGLATPAALVTGLGKAAQWGIWYKNPASIEVASGVSHIVLDKTGTLTQGNPQLVEIVKLQPTEKWESVIYSMELLSKHPLSKPLVEHFKNVEQIQLQNFEDIAGKGLKAEFKEDVFFVGTKKFLQQNSIQTQVVDDETEKKQNSGNTMVYFASQKLGILGYAVFFDSLKEEALKLISGLKSQNIVPIILSGDTEASVKNVAHQLGIEEWKSACLPSDKSEYIKVLKAKGHKVAMVGDGINDIEALAVADIGIAVGEGAESAREISGVNLIRNDISLVSFALKIANKTNKTLRTNLFWAFSYNVLMIPLAAGVLYPLTGWMLNPMIAGVAMAFSSVSVLGNSLLLRTLKV